MAYNPSTPAGNPSAALDHGLLGQGMLDISPDSATSSNNTFLMPNSPVRKGPASDMYRPKVTRTVGQRPACLINASVTYCGNGHIYAFGGFDQFTDEVYNHVLRLDLATHQWSLVDNYGDIPGVRMGHTASLYEGNKLLIFGGENEHRSYLSDLIIFDLQTARWHAPAVSGVRPRGRARHAAMVHDDKLFIAGGISGHNNFVLDDICYLDLKTFTWSRAWRFVGRFDHSMYVWDDRVWILGGISEEMDKTGDIWWLDLKGNPAFHSTASETGERQITPRSPRPAFAAAPSTTVRGSGYAANTSSAQVNPPSFQLTGAPPIAPGAIGSFKFHSGPNVPTQGSGMHFNVYTSGTLLDFVTPSPVISSQDCSMSALDLETMRWQRLAEGRDIFKSGYKWHYCVLNEDGTKAWLLGCPSDPAQNDLGPGVFEQHLSDIMEVDLRRYGLLGDNASPASRFGKAEPSTKLRVPIPLSKGLSADLGSLFNRPPEEVNGGDFVITALSDDDEEMTNSSLASYNSSRIWLDPGARTSPPIHVHKLILQARWPHFARLYTSQMAEFHTKRMHIPEPYTVVKTFLHYLYTDNIQPDTDDCGSLGDVAGLLVMSNIYAIPHLRALCVHRLLKELDVEHACIIWHSAATASEEWLRRHAAKFCQLYWGRVVRTEGFQKLPRQALVELSQEIDAEGRVVGGDELEVVGGLGGAKFGVGGVSRKASVSSNRSAILESEDDTEEMEIT